MTGHRVQERTWMTRARHQAVQNQVMLLPRENTRLPAATVTITKMSAVRGAIESITADATTLPTCSSSSLSQKDQVLILLR